MTNQINTIAHRIADWARKDTMPVEKTLGYCMSGNWNGFYQRLLFPNKTLRVDVLEALIQKLRQLGFYASLAIVPISGGNGLHMHMQLQPIKQPRLIAAELPSTSAQDLYVKLRNDSTLPDKFAFDRMAADPTVIPEELRIYDLVFPRVVDQGLFEGGGADRVTDDSINMLVWNDKKWEPRRLLAGPLGWGHSGPDFCGPRARLARFATV